MLIWTSLALLAASLTLAVATYYSVNVPPRYMWGWGSPDVPGYCGEASLQSAGLFYGNWVTQEAVLKACGSSCLVGVNEESAAVKLAFTIAKFSPSSPADYFDFIKTHLAAGHPVVGTWYMAGMDDSDYDHITPITGLLTDDSGSVTQLTYNDLYLPTARNASIPADVKSRSKCYAADPQQPYTYCVPKGTDYALAVTGLNDPLKELYPVTLDVHSWNEPDDGSEDKYHPPQPAVIFTPTAVVSGLTAGSTYTLLRFDSVAALPAKGGFLGTWASHGWSVQVNFTATGSTASLSLAPIISNGTFFYRAVTLPKPFVDEPEWQPDAAAPEVVEAEE